LTATKRGDRDFFRAHARATHVAPEQLDKFLDDMVRFHNLYLDLVDAGVDWLAETVKACRRRKIAPWVSVRMNDTHGVEDPASTSIARYFAIPANRLSGRATDPTILPTRIGSHSTTRASRCAISCSPHIREYIEDYGFEGMELDWLRDPHVPRARRAAEQARVVTDWLREVRAYTEARRIPLGLRIPANLGYLRSRGLDVRTIAREGLVDFIGFSNFWQTSWDLPYEQLRAEVGPDVVIYGVVEDAPNWVPADKGVRYMSASAPMLHANAAGKLAMGVHGIEQFNFFCTDQLKVPGLRGDYAALRGTHDLGALRGKPKHYCLSSPSGRLSTLWETPEQIRRCSIPSSAVSFVYRWPVNRGRAVWQCRSSWRRAHSPRGWEFRSTAPGPCSMHARRAICCFPWVPIRSSATLTPPGNFLSMSRRFAMAGTRSPSRITPKVL
jgi:hypothetical protein